MPSLLAHLLDVVEANEDAIPALGQNDQLLCELLFSDGHSAGLATHLPVFPVYDSLRKLPAETPDTTTHLTLWVITY